mmetsp:Transcript_10320/g.29018  ORF Transcript_10320/g.29018 Transcript_10320/m.29018 type:complete len:221 (-) Transcript_10320:173-835(-)
MKISSLSALILATLTGRVAAGNFLFLNYQGWYENFGAYDDWHRNLAMWGEEWSKNPNLPATGSTMVAEKKDKKKSDKVKGAAQSKSAPGAIDPNASFDCYKDNKGMKGTMCDVVLVAVNNKHCPTNRPTALAKGTFSDWQWNKTTGVSDAIEFTIECCGAGGCTPAMMPVEKYLYVIQQLPDGKNKVVPGLAVFGPVADDKNPIADGEKTVIIRMGGGLK